MDCIVTAGPTFEPLDDVRRLTNFSTGRLGTELANFLTARGHRVTLLLGESATWAGERRARQVRRFSTTKELHDQLQALANRRVAAVFHAAAVSDFAFGKMFARTPGGSLRAFTPGKKISTRRGRLLVELVPMAKIIAELRGWYPRAWIVGWKFEAEGGQPEALQAGRRQMRDCATDACVVNGPAYGPGFGLLTQKESRRFAGKAGLFATLEKLGSKSAATPQNS